MTEKQVFWRVHAGCRPERFEACPEDLLFPDDYFIKKFNNKQNKILPKEHRVNLFRDYWEAWAWYCKHQ
jgi:hypothetical protein